MSDPKDVKALVGAGWPKEQDVTLSDGTVVRVTGLWAVQYPKDPDAVRRDIKEVNRTRGGKGAA
jgi:hypothetical protein